MRTTIDPRAIAIGSVVDNVATVALVSLLPVVLSGIAQNSSLLQLTLDSDRSLFVLEFAGLVSTAIGGYIAARISRAAQLRHGAGVGLVALAVGVLSQAGPAADLPGWYTASAFALIVPAGMLGGFLARLRFAAALRRAA